MSSQTTTYFKSLRDIKKRWHSIPILVRSSCLAGSLWGTTWLVPSLIFREDYLGLAVDPASFPQIGFVLGHILLGTVPVFGIWLWFPKETTKFAKSLSPFVICRTTDKLVVCRKWHFPFSIALVAVVMIGFLQALSRDTIVEWFEVLGWWGWSFPAILFSAQGVVITNALLAIRQFNIWFKKEVNRGLMIQPLHHDGRGGLRFIADTLWRLIWFAVTLGFWLILFNLQNIFSNNQERLPNWYSIDLRLYVYAGFIFSVYVYFILGIPACSLLCDT